MDETIEKAVKAVTDIISGYSWADQAFLNSEIAGKLMEQMHECLMIEYNLIDK
jgi:hypothetical protein